MKKTFPLIIIFTITAVGAYYFLGPKDLYVRHSCKLQSTGNCLLKSEEAEIDFKISPLPINPLNELTYTLSAKGIEVQKATVRLIGHDMQMDEQQLFNLEKLDNGAFVAKRIFPICTEKTMIWRLYLIIKGKRQTLRTLYDLQVKKR